MCGIAGCWHLAGEREETLRAHARRMAGRLAHRGPDDAAEWVDASAGVALGFRRLAILDLSPTGAQPMVSSDGRLVIVFNGEVYNFRELRGELEAAGGRFRGTSDTEVVLAACARWGVEAALPRLWGMFAFALWDRADRTLTLARDRLGKKPLYVAQRGRILLFGSELKALRAHPDCPGEIDREALALFMRLGYVPSPRSILAGVGKLLPGELVVAHPDGRLERRLWWDAAETVGRAVRERRPVGEEQALEELDALLRDAVARRMVADVPLGAFLSGGVDSSVVVALMQAQSARPVRTFSVGFEESSHDEAPAAASVARHLGTDHTELLLTPEAAQAAIPRVAAIYDEPFADFSQIPTLLVSELARRSVTVSLSGDGGDEVFGGYTRYLWASSLTRAGRLLRPLAPLIRRAARTGSPPAWDALIDRVRPALPRRAREVASGERWQRVADLVAGGPAGLYGRLVTRWHQASPVAGVPVPLPADAVRASLPSVAERMMLLDLVTFLPDDILVKLDRASMAVSLEGRCPLLDHRLVEWAWRLPVHLRVHRGEGKPLLRRLLRRHLPAALVERPKHGFGVPVGAWLRGPLRDWAESLLDERRLGAEGLLDVRVVRAGWREHLAGRANREQDLWAALMLESWLDAWKVFA